MTDKAACSSRGQGLAVYFVLLSVQTAGVVLLLAYMIPLYRLMAMDFANYRPDVRPWWAFAGVLTILIAYWVRVWLRPALPQAGNIVLGHVVAFFARISFVSVTAAFTVMFLNRFEVLLKLNYSPLRALVVLIIFFSIFCWTLELERLAKALQGNQP